MHVPALFNAGLVEIVSPIFVGTVYIALCSLLAEPQRRHFNAIIIAGAGAAYLNGGFGPWEFAFATILAYLAYRGLHAYRFIAIGWLLHSGWDVMHDLYGNPIIPFDPTSSLGCAICDPVIALWCFAGAPSILDLVRRFRPMAR
jgi:cytochrome c biogenesis protein CcdA